MSPSRLTVLSLGTLSLGVVRLSALSVLTVLAWPGDVDAQDRPRRGTAPRPTASATARRAPQRPDTLWAPSTAAISPADLDSTSAPCEDFYQYAVGGWYRRAPAPLRDSLHIGSDPNRPSVALQQLVAAAPALARTTSDPTLRAVGYFYGSCLVDASGTASGAVGDTARASYCFRTTRAHLDRALYQLFLDRLWPPAARAQSRLLESNLKQASIDRIVASRALADSTKQAVVSKVSAITITAKEYADLKGGVPFPGNILTQTAYQDYRGLVLSPTDFAQNLARLRAFPDTLPPLTSPGQRSILDVILQRLPVGDHVAGLPPAPIVDALNHLIPPLVDGTLDIGGWYGTQSPLGHHITHAYERPVLSASGSERRQFAEEQFRGQWNMGDSHQFNDHFGMLVMYDAFKLAMRGQPQTRIDGFTPEQRFFLGIARAWIGNKADVDPVGVGQARARVLTNGALSAMPAFAQAFGCKAGGPMTGALIWHLLPWGETISARRRLEFFNFYVTNRFLSGDAVPARVLDGLALTLTQTQKSTMEGISTDYQARRSKLFGLFGTSRADTTAHYRRLLDVFAQQLAAYRAVLTPEEQALFDPHAQRWMQHQQRLFDPPGNTGR